MAINKNFVVRHGLEVDSGLIFANADTNKVGIASTGPRYELDVRGGIGATDVIASGVGTFVNGLRVGTGGTILTANSNSYVGIGTGDPIYPLEVHSSGTTTSVYVQGGVKVAGLTSTQDLAVSGVSTFYNSSLGNVVIGAGNTALVVAGDARVTGILTIGTSSITIDGVNNKINVGLGFTITSDGIEVSSTGINTIPNIVSSSANITNLYSSGISTLGVTSVTDLTSQNINNTGITTLGVTNITNLTSQNINNTGITTLGVTNITDLTSQNIYNTGITTLGVTTVTNLTVQNLNASGINTLSGVEITGDSSAGVATITAAAGFTTVYYVGDGSGLYGVVASGSVSQSVIGGIASVTELNVTGITTLGVTSATNLTTQNIYNTGITTLGITSVTDLTTQNIYNSGITTLGITSTTNLTTQNIYNTGITTLGITSVTDLTSQNINVSGVVTATTFFGNLTGTASTASASSTAYGLTGNPDIIVGFATVNNDLIVSGNLTVNGTQTIINTSVLDVEDINVGIATTTSTLSNSLLDGAGITIYGSAGDKTLTYSNSKNAFETNIPIATNELRVLSGAEKITRIDGNTATINYSTTGSNVGLCTNPSGDITLNVNNIPTTGDFDDYSITFAVIVNSTGTARTCTAVNLNGVSRTIKWAGGSLGNSISGVTTTNGYSIYNFTGINTVGSASTTDNYEVFGSVAGGFY